MMPDVSNVTKFVLEGRIVTMDEQMTVLPKGTIYVRDGIIEAVQDTAMEAPDEFKDPGVIRIKTGGTIYPGLIELHNHLSYNILPMWIAPKRFDRREQWRNREEKRKLITGPMKVLGKTPTYVEAIVRYVECKCLVSGVTTSQGLRLYGVGTQAYYEGLIRNVENSGIHELPNALTKISDVEAKDADAFLERQKKCDCLLLHLSEGIDDRSRDHFEALQYADEKWAITDSLAGIHCTALTQEHFRVMKQHDASMIWSPLSNLILYGETSKIHYANDEGLTIALGSDWSPSGSKNLLCELKVAKLVSESQGTVFEDKDLVAMVTINPAKILKWGDKLGSLEATKLADLLIIRGDEDNAYSQLINAKEAEVDLVVIGGVARYGDKTIMENLMNIQEAEELDIVGETKLLNLREEKANPVVGRLALKTAQNRLQKGLHKLAELAEALEDPNSAVALLAEYAFGFENYDEMERTLKGKNVVLDNKAKKLLKKPAFFIELELDELDKEALRPHLPSRRTSELTGGWLDDRGSPSDVARGLIELVNAGIVYSEILKDVKIDLDPLTTVDDKEFFRRLSHQPNLPDFIRTGLPEMFGVDPHLDYDAQFIHNVREKSAKSQLMNTTLLSTFLSTEGYLTLADRQRIVEQALLLLDQVYVHLPLKRAMHAIDPVQGLRLMQHRLQQQQEQHYESMKESTFTPEIEFHKDISRIFTSTRDLHTVYLLPYPFNRKTAYLPFLIEEFFDKEESKYMVSHIMEAAADKLKKEGFVKGVEVLYWNGIPIQRAIELNADKQAGSNSEARRARGIDTLTIRPMKRVLPPDEEWVRIGFRLKSGDVAEIKHNWLVFSPDSSLGFRKMDSIEATAFAFDIQTDAVHQIKKILIAPKALEEEKAHTKSQKLKKVSKGSLDTRMPWVFKAMKVPKDNPKYGYIRIFTFNVENADIFIDEFSRLCEALPKDGLIIDVRGNGGGLIYAAERLLQLLTHHIVEPQGAQFINTPLTLEICRRHEDSKMFPNFKLKPWIDSIEQSVESGSIYSRAFPITKRKDCNNIGQKYFGPVVLITDALCYSATDMFAAGFQDHEIGHILGTSWNTGAGGANVWSHQLLQVLLSDSDDSYSAMDVSPFRSLPWNSGMRVAVRRILRVRNSSGIPLEDFGVVPDTVHLMTEDDILYSNRKLLDAAIKIIEKQRVYKLKIVKKSFEGERWVIKVETKNIMQIDVYIDKHPACETIIIKNQKTEISFDAPMIGSGEVELMLKGFSIIKDDTLSLVAVCRKKIDL